MYILGKFIHIIIDCWIFTRKHTLIFSSEQKRKWKQGITRIIYYSSCRQIVAVKTMIYSSFHMTQDVAVAILPLTGRTGVRCVAGSKTKTFLSSGVLPSRQGPGGRLSISEGVAPGYS